MKDGRMLAGLLAAVAVFGAAWRLRAAELPAAGAAVTPADPAAVIDRFAEDVGLPGLRAPVTGVGLLRQLAEATGHVLRVTESEDGTVRVTVDRLALRRHNRAARRGFRRFMEAHFPAAAAAAVASYGLFPVARDGRCTTLAQAGKLPADLVVLVHGLDEPGSLWQDLIPALRRRHFHAAVFCYPNDQPVHDSARLLAQALTAVGQAGAERVTLVCHSMGGLVSRELLTHPALRGRQDAGAGAGALPAIIRLIMIGTPNHGSELARLRAPLEVRDQLVRMFRGDGLLLGATFDGAGEAMFDLLPDSEFLQQLNARPPPRGVAMTIIAGRASPLQPRSIRRAGRRLEEMVPGFSATDRARIESLLGRLVDGVGDGVVTVASTRLAGVTDHVIVTGNHLTMLYNVLPDHDRVPPAVPIILARLKADRQCRLEQP